jgi:CRP-like cAMP-binding protein
MDRSLRLISPLERAFHLKRLGGLRDIPPADLAAIALLAHENSFARGAVIYRRGERVERVHVVVDGRVRVRGGEHGDDVVGAGDTIGLLSLLARDDIGLDAVAETDTVTLALRADDLLNAFEEDFGILYSQTRDLATETLRLRKRIPEGTYLASATKLAEPPAGDIDLVQRLLYLRRGGLGNANMDALMAMAQRMETARFEPGAELWRIGRPSGFLYYLLSGRVRCTTEDGTQFACGPGYPLGNLESQCGAPRWYDAVTETAVTALQHDTDVFLDTIEQHFEVALDFVAGMASGLIARRAEMRTETVAGGVA